ncbi:hypothetical protein AHAS_Ahas07G0044900 [Arachis hypogaea]
MVSRGVVCNAISLGEPSARVREVPSSNRNGKVNREVTRGLGNDKPDLGAGEVQSVATAFEKGNKDIGKDTEADGCDAASVAGSESSESKWANKMQENKEAWELAVESGAVQYNEEDDNMAILQVQNEAITQKKKLAKQKEKARRSRPKNRKKVCINALK